MDQYHLHYSIIYFINTMTKNLIIIFLLVFGGAAAYTSFVKATPKLIVKKHIDVIPPQPVINDVSGKNALFIGDSHTAASYGWQYVLCKKTNMKQHNTAIGGKQTAWMLETAKLHMSSNYDYCFIYGGANDMAGNRSPMKSVKNIQSIVKLCHVHQVIPIVITGFDPITCIDITGRNVYKGYPQRYAKFQQLLIDSIHGATVIKTHCISKTDCGDYLCHMTGSGHRKMANCIIDFCKFKRYE